MVGKEGEWDDGCESAGIFLPSITSRDAVGEALCAPQGKASAALLPVCLACAAGTDWRR